ncbi:hypothetical protein C7999DRAFT_31434 [Corynascus novoguineensis]|uniref:Uncharacterized protein n=1 Tax=Corynascus novoguineensis TaxID=1126955 RepID=A0AAN7HPL3_9PEZI|nr:hypothetical protein C7999DRAFT_31434 [Corynascus novoguineensis]
MANRDRRAVPTHLVEHDDDDHSGQRGCIKGSNFARHHGSPSPSTQLRLPVDPRSAPTLVALKQHAQSLCVLIHAVNPTLESAEVAGGDPKGEPGIG